MQKKICLILLGYMAVLSVVGVGLYFHERLQNLPILEKALVEEILTFDEETGQKPQSTEKTETSDPIPLPEEDTGSNYWENYEQGSQGTTDHASTESRLKEADISSGDQMKVLKIVKKSLSNDEIMYILSLAKNGFTADEKTEIKTLLRSKLSDSDLKELKSVVLKYL
ncbi:hypothetical protein [Candidatus Formimonas warabiya]|uniref:Uncharacterized protein n=1 Tax=Formimonas warabiya TaxID=1761012 RepID=A0A3G1KU00_FORW1|nr:hypothetical protein [Candidatus Formimonas warabiya]ATW25948.1 hypothetical protein DCMF_15240 [Candidatus Formimonas warabiya]